jgi:hypothetical protein
MQAAFLADQSSQEAAPAQLVLVHSDSLIDMERHTCCSTQAALAPPGAMAHTRSR